MKLSRGHWLFATLFTAVACLASIWLIDDRVARIFAEPARHYNVRRFEIGAAAFIVPIVTMSIFLNIQALRGRSLSRLSKAIMLSGRSAVVAFGICEFVLKPIFGRQTVYYYLAQPRMHGFMFMQGDYKSSFPSGHTAIVVAVLAVFWQFYPRWAPIYVGAFIVSSAILVGGEWHFVSDIIAGAFLGGAWGLACSPPRLASS